MPDATPIFTTRDPATGAVLFEFTGKIHAEGIVLDAGPVGGGGATQLQRVEWRKGADEANPVIGEVTSYAQSPSDARNYRVGVRRDNQAAFTGIDGTVSADGTSAQANVWAGGNSAMLLRQDMQSDFLLRDDASRFDAQEDFAADGAWHKLPGPFAQNLKGAGTYLLLASANGFTDVGGGTVMWGIGVNGAIPVAPYIGQRQGITAAGSGVTLTIANLITLPALAALEMWGLCTGGGNGHLRWKFIGLYRADVT